MADDRKPFWTTLPGIISGIAATITGLAVLIPLLLGVAGKHPNKNAASHSPSPGVTSSTGVTSTTGGDTASPPPSEGSTPFPTDSSSGSNGSPTLGITADPSSVNFSSGKAVDATVTIKNPGSTDVIIEKVELNGPNAAAFGITSTSCGEASALPAGQSCQVAVHYTPPALGSTSAALIVHYNPPQSSFTTVQLKGSAALLG